MQIPELKRFNIIDNQQFQNLIVDIFNYRDNVNSYFIYGRNGQSQNSIDVFSSETKTAIQCKYKRDSTNNQKNRKLLKNEIVSEIENFRNNKFDFTHFIFASTYVHDREIQDFCINYKEKNNLPYNLSYLGWNEIEKNILNNQNIIKKYYPNLLLEKEFVEFSRIDIDSANCSWLKSDEYDYVFFDTPSYKSSFPIFNFYFFNNSSNQIALFDVKLKIEFLPHDGGLSGFPNEIFKIEPFTKYEFIIDKKREFYRPNNFEPIGIPAKFPFSFQTQILFKGADCYYELTEKYLFYFEFYFNNNIIVKIPALYLNTNTENIKSDRNIYYLS